MVKILKTGSMELGRSLDRCHPKKPQNATNVSWEETTKTDCTASRQASRKSAFSAMTEHTDPLSGRQSALTLTL
jgi:hypothetical protein